MQTDEEIDIAELSDAQRVMMAQIALTPGYQFSRLNHLPPSASYVWNCHTPSGMIYANYKLASLIDTVWLEIQRDGRLARRADQAAAKAERRFTRAY